MKNDFLIAITQLCAEKNLPREAVFEAVEAALISAYRRYYGPNQNINVKIFPTTGEIKVFAQKEVAEKVEDRRTQMSVLEAREVQPDANVGDLIEVESTPHDFGRISAQTAKQVVLQRLREAERKVVFDEFIDKEGDIVSGVIQRLEPRQITIDLGKTEAVLPAQEQVPSERYRAGQRLKAYVIEVTETGKGPQVIVSRTNRNLLRRLFELEVPEIFNGIVEIKSIAREPGSRSKVAVAARQEGVDPVGSCVGLRGIRIQNIVNELNGEKIDVVQWHPDPAVFVANALSPAQVVTVDVNEDEKTALVVVPDRQLSLAIGKEGQNARLAARLTGWRIDIKSLTAVRTEELARAEAAALAAAQAPAEPVVSEEPVAAVEAVGPEAATLAPVEPVTAEPPVEAPMEVPAAAVEPAVPAEAVPAAPAAEIPVELPAEATAPAPIPTAPPAEVVADLPPQPADVTPVAAEAPAPATAEAPVVDEEELELLRLLEAEQAAAAVTSPTAEPSVAPEEIEEEYADEDEEYEDEEYDEDEEDEEGATVPVLPTPVASGRPQIRFAEDIFGEEYMRGKRKKDGASGKKKPKRGARTGAAAGGARGGGGGGGGFGRPGGGRGGPGGGRGPGPGGRGPASGGRPPARPHR